jgi:hypothetical protein
VVETEGDESPVTDLRGMIRMLIEFKEGFKENMKK